MFLLPRGFSKPALERGLGMAILRPQRVSYRDRQSIFPPTNGINKIL